MATQAGHAIRSRLQQALIGAQIAAGRLGRPKTASADRWRS
jgi:hypothetical protein